MKIEYHNELEMYVNDDLLYKGKVLIYDDNSCEGIVYDKNNQKNYIFGIFEKYKKLDLSIINGGKTENFIAKKAYLKYVGEYRVIKDNVVNKEPFYLTASSLDVDPRDYVWIGLPSHIFKEELDNFKKENNIDNNQEKGHKL